MSTEERLRGLFATRGFDWSLSSNGALWEIVGKSPEGAPLVYGAGSTIEHAIELATAHLAKRADPDATS
jgi:hypothetical protein